MFAKGVPPFAAAHPLWRIIFVLFLLCSGIASADPARAAGPVWQSLAPGIDYGAMVVPGPNHVYITRMDRHNPNVTLETGIGMGTLANGTETVREMAVRFDGSLSYWGGSWGGRSQVVAAINGFYFDPETGVPWQGMVQSGWYSQRFTDRQNGSGFVWKLDGSAFIGECVSHPKDKQVVLFDNGKSLELDGLNTARQQNQLILYTPQYDASTPQGDAGVEVLVEMTGPTLIARPREGVHGVIRQIRRGNGDTPLPFDHVVLSASGRAAAQLLSLAHMGDTVSIAQNLKSLSAGNCRTNLGLDWTGAYTAIGGGFHFLKNGEVISSYDIGAITRSPRTAIAYNQDYIFFIVVDGRNPGTSEGMTIDELALFSQQELAAQDGIAMDGGGSSILIASGKVVNSPSDGIETDQEPVSWTRLRAISERSDGHLTPEELAIQITRPYSRPENAPTAERPVANALFMVVVQPPEFSRSLQIGSGVILQSDAAIYSGPGPHYPLVQIAPAGSSGRILPHLAGLNGVFLDEQHWWKVELTTADGILSGWVAEKQLKATPIS